jgi:hypothetical protein
MLKRAQSSKPPHPSLILYSAISQNYFFDEKKYLQVRDSLINYLTQNLREVFQILGEIISPKDMANSPNVMEILKTLEDPACDQIILLVLCAESLGSSLRLVYFNQKAEL